MTRASTALGFHWAFVLDRIRRALLPLCFATFSALTAGNLATHGFLFIDIGVYRDAAKTALAGGNPWSAAGPEVAFAAPPPTLLFALPMAVVPYEVAVVVTVGILVAAGIWSVRRLSVPYWWLLFPPLFECFLVGNLDVLVLAFLLAKGPLAGMAAVAKVYGAVPLVLQRRWRALTLAALVSLVTLPLWSMFFAELGNVITRLDQQSQGFSAWGTWWMIPTIAALWLLRRRGAEWLVVPGLWPSTQMHYATLSLPVIHRFPIAAVLMGLSSPLTPAFAIILVALQIRLGFDPEPEPRR